MKTILNIKEKPTPEIKFPCIATAAGGLTVLFVDIREGVCLSSGSSCWRVGYYCDDWESVSDKITWRILQPGESVTLVVE